jgi:hypothetical protein
VPSRLEAMERLGQAQQKSVDQALAVARGLDQFVPPP